MTIEPIDMRSRSPLRPAPSFRVPACTYAMSHGRWSVREYEPLPQFHRPASWDLERIRRVAADVSQALDGGVKRPSHIPSHWIPMHGDLVPWNLREDDSGQLWLVDWEDVGWGPPLADLFRFIVAHYSLRRSTPTRIAARVRSLLARESPTAVAEVTRFWLNHHNFQPMPSSPNWPRQKAKDATRAAREFAALSVLSRVIE